MKLSDAIMLGATLRPQAFGDFTDGRGTCAAGAAREALGLEIDTTNPILTKVYPWVEKVFAKCPDSQCWVTYNCAFIVVHLNDYHLWTREQIAGWVATIEPQEEPIQIPETIKQEELEIA